MTDLKGRHFLTLIDYSPEEILYLLDYARKLKEDKKAGKTHDLLKGKNIVLLFEKTSTRTRCAFEVAGHDEGAHVTFLSNSQMGKKESIEDTAKVLGRMFDGIEFRGFDQSTVETLARESGVPVWNGLTDFDHPTQILADMLTIQEHLGEDLKGKKLVFVGDARNNMGNALMIGCAKLGLDFAAFAPKELWPDEKLVEEMMKVAEETGATITFSDDPSVVEGADVIYTDIWVSMGEEDLIEERLKLLTPFQVNKELMARTGKDTLFMHCLPAFHDDNTVFSAMVKDKYGIGEMEVTDEVFRSPASVVFDEAENRMHTIKAVMCATLSDDPNKIFEEV